MMTRRKTDLPEHFTEANRLEPLSRHDVGHDLAASRCKNVAAAIENLLTQLEEGWCAAEFTMWLRAIKEVYEHERLWHLSHAEKDSLFPKEA